MKVEHSYSQDFVDQAKCKEQALNHDRQRCQRRLPGRGPVRPRRPVGGEGEEGVRGRRRRRPGLPRSPRPDERHEEGRRRRVRARSRPPRAAVRLFKTNFNAIFTVKNNGVGYGKISTRAQPSALKAASRRPHADRHRARSRSSRSPRRHHRLGRTNARKGRVAQPAPSGITSRVSARRLLPPLLGVLALAGCGGDDSGSDDDGDGADDTTAATTTAAGRPRDSGSGSSPTSAASTTARSTSSRTRASSRPRPSSASRAGSSSRGRTPTTSPTSRASPSRTTTS